MSLIQWEPENSEIERRLLESSFNFKKCDEHEKQQLSSVSRPILLNQWFNKCLTKLFAFQQNQMHLSIDVLSSSNSIVFWSLEYWKSS